MKHIQFEESTGMNELARIASEKGIVKVAQDPMDFMSQPSKPTSPNINRLLKGDATVTFNEVWPEVYPYLNYVYKFESKGNMLDFNTKVAPVISKLEQLIINHFRASQDMTGAKKYLSDLAKMQTPQKGNASAPMASNNDDSFNATANEYQSKHTKKKADKNGTNDLYNVTKETGEDLVEKAHPGGGTKTELTHSKTDENLVETIVEQQQRDIEVANKVPKGTYATLKSLHNALSKMGHSEKLNELDAIINIIATPQDILNEELSTLSDKLDQKGYHKVANKVDRILHFVNTTKPKKKL